MPLQPDGTAPYAPPATIIAVIDRARERGLPTPVTKDVLGRSGIPESLIPRTLQALQLLELLNEDGTWTQNLDILRRAPEGEFQARLSEILRSVYADVFQYADPEKDSATQVRDAFRAFTPHGQQDRMVTLFLGLCQKAGIVTGDSQPKSMHREKNPAKKTATKKVIQRERQVERATGAGSGMDLPAPLTGLLATVPKSGSGWTKHDRDRFVKAFEAMLDYSIPVRDKEPDAPKEDV